MNQDQNQYSIDYLNQIAPQAPKKGLSGKLPLIFVILGILTLLTIILVLLTNIGSNGQAPERLAARLQSTSTIVSDSQATIKSSQLRSLNSNLDIYLTNTNRDLTEPLLTDDIDVTELDETLLAQESGAEISETLEDARLNANFDPTYAREMAFQLETTMLLMQEIFTDTQNAALRDVLSSAYKNLAPIQEEFAAFNATTN